MENLTKMENQIVYLDDSHSVWAKVTIRNENMVTYELMDSGGVLSMVSHHLKLLDAIAKFGEIYPHQKPKCELYQHHLFVTYLYERSY